LGTYHKLAQYKWGLIALTVGFIGSSGSLTIIYTPSTIGQ